MFPFISMVLNLCESLLFKVTIQDPNAKWNNRVLKQISKHLPQKGLLYSFMNCFWYSKIWKHSSSEYEIEIDIRFFKLMTYDPFCLYCFICCDQQCVIGCKMFLLLDIRLHNNFLSKPWYGKRSHWLIFWFTFYVHVDVTRNVWN